MSDPSLLSDLYVLARLAIGVTSWMGDPAVMTAMASLLTAVAAFWRSRHRRTNHQPPAPHPPHSPPSLAEAYSTLHEAEEKIREELLQQLQHLQEEAERIGDDLSHYRQATVMLEEAILRCPYGSCPVREQLETP
ncbi:MAG: hypothetical protein R3F54_20850 [Alphaproteobacteria bacterium]